MTTRRKIRTNEFRRLREFRCMGFVQRYMEAVERTQPGTENEYGAIGLSAESWGT
jgi:hypothetical protein